MAKPKMKSRAKRPVPSKRRARKQEIQAANAANPGNCIQEALNFQKVGDLVQAASIYRQILKEKPDHADAWHLLGMTLFSLNQLAEAQECVEKSLQWNPDRPDVLGNFGVIHRESGNLDLAKAALEKSIEMEPKSAITRNSLGTVYSELGHLEEAKSEFEKALSIDPTCDQAAMNLGNVWQKQGNVVDAESIYRSILERHPQDPLLLINLGEALRQQGKWEEAYEVNQTAVSISPNNVEALINLGRCLTKLGKIEEAKSLFLQMAETDPQFHKPLLYLGKLYFGERDFEKAEAYLVDAQALEREDPYVLNSLGFVHLEKGDMESAEECFRLAISYDPSLSDAHSSLLFVLSGKAHMDQAELFEEHRKWALLHGEVQSVFSHAELIAKRIQSEPRKLRVGYVSPDFRQHAVAAFIRPILQSHDQKQFEIFCYSEVAEPDQTTQELSQLANHWRSTVGFSDQQVAEQVLRDEVDILIDLAGHTSNNRLLVFAHRPAPIQVTWMGYPNTTGLETIDYRLTCKVQNPVDEPSQHSEELFRMPRGSFCFSKPKHKLVVQPSPAAENGYVTFGSLHRPSKITEAARNLWASVLNRRPESRLLLFNTRFSDESAATLRCEMGKLGVDESRIEIRYTFCGESYLTAYREIDIALDVTPWAGGTTTLEALWMGVPVIAYYGDRRSARSTAAILNTLGHPELIAHSFDGYSQLASELASDLSQLKDFRTNLRRRVEETLLDSKEFTQDLENAYRTMWNRLIA